MNARIQTTKYLISDILASSASWSLFYIFRKLYIESQKFGYTVPIEFTARFYWGVFLIPAFWVLIHYLSGYYKDIFRKSRLKELGKTFFTTLIGVTILFFTIILDDEIVTYHSYYQLFGALFLLQFVLTYLPRVTITSITNNKIHSGEIGFNTIIIGSNKRALDIFQKINNQIESTGHHFIGFVHIEERNNYLLNQHLSHLGGLELLSDLISKNKIEEVIIALESSEHKEIEKIINLLDNTNVVIKAIPSMYDILTGKVKMNHIFGTPLIQISHDLMPTWQQHLKQFLDIVLSLIALVLTSPLALFLILGIKLTSKGPVIYSHERIGKFGKPFTLYKFRSMYIDAESNGPALSSKNDSRITPFGKFMRKSKLDEVPNFINVLKGDMSLVGPRPERQYYIDRIVERAPHYLHLQKVKPGITSWGQVKYGYAENVDQMIERLKYDILYIENMSLYVDFKIMIHTILTILKGRNI